MIPDLKFGNRNLQWKDKCCLTLYIWAWYCTFPTYFPSLSVPAESTHGKPLVWVKAVCGQCGPQTCFHHSTVVQCNVIKSIWFFNKGGTPLAKTTLNMTLNQLGSYQNVPIIFFTPTQLSSQCYLSLRNYQRKYNCVETTEHDFKLCRKTDNTMNWSIAMLLLRTKSNLRLTMSWLD